MQTLSGILDEFLLVQRLPLQCFGLYLLSREVTLLYLTWNMLFSLWFLAGPAAYTLRKFLKSCTLVSEAKEVNRLGSVLEEAKKMGNILKVSNQEGLLVESEGENEVVLKLTLVSRGVAAESVLVLSAGRNLQSFNFL